MEFFVFIAAATGMLLAGAVNTQGLEVRSGKIHLNTTSDYPYACRDVTYPIRFRNLRDIRVQVSLSHGNAFRKVHDPGAVWVKKVTSQGFQVCVREAGTGSNGSAVVNWMAFQGNYNGLEQGFVDFDDWTVSTQCKRVQPTGAYSKSLQVFASVVVPDSSDKYNAMNVWIEDGLSFAVFRICIREMVSFDGVHRGIRVAWFAYEKMTHPWNITNQITFDPNSVPTQQNNYALCQAVNFTNSFYDPPVVLLTASHHNNDSRSKSQECNAINSWIEEISKSHFRVCMKDFQGEHSKAHPIKVNYIVLGDLDPCLNVSCDFFAVCKAFGPHDGRCVCKQNCPSYEEQVCSTNATTFKNKCLFELEMCRLKSNHTLYHPGSCRGFPLERGRTAIIPSSKEETVCKEIRFRPFAFYPDKQVHVQLTVNHINTSNPNFVHDAMASWVENVNFKGFTACVTTAGRNNRPRVAMASVDWFAYQGAPAGGVAERTRIRQWWTGTTCETINLPVGKFQGEPTVLATAEHISAAFQHDAASLWIEDITSTSFKACLRELQNFDGLHQDIHVSWMAFEDLHRPLFTEKGMTFFPNTGQPSMRYNGAFCKDVKYSRSYSHVPTVVLSTNHASSSGSLSPACNGVSTWNEYLNTTGLRICVKELYTTKYEPLTVNYLLLSDICSPGWSYFDGICFNTTSSCDTWTNSESRCRSAGANLATIRSQRENVYVQHRLNGEKGWIGLNDRSVEGDFWWSSNMRVNWTYWAANQPNDFNNQDCVHTLGVRHGYRWNDVPCTGCQNYTCSKDLDECHGDRHGCHDDASCTNSYGSYSCHCNTGYSGNGKNCTDINECLRPPCGSNSTCANTKGSYVCQCNAGYSGDGFTCTDVDECTDNSHECDSNAVCTNTQGSHDCTCNRGYHGNGTTCTQMQYRGLDVSSILSYHGDTRYIQTLSSYLDPVIQSSSSSLWTRCWRAQTDGWAASTFHLRCDNKGPTVTIIRVGNYVFGGYTEYSWQSRGGYTSTSSSSSFLYTLYNTYGYYPQKMTRVYTQHSIYDVSSYGPTFGNGHDIYISDSASLNQNSYTYTHAYQTPRGCSRSNSCTTLAGSFKFTPSDVEVFYETTA